MTTTSNRSSSDNGAAAVSAYAPLRRNSFLEHPQTTGVATRVSTLTVGLTLIIIRFWKDARIWQEVLTRLLPNNGNILRTYLQKWRLGSTRAASTLLRQLLKGLQTQLAPFLLLATTAEEEDNHKSIRASSNSNHHGDAPTSILCDTSSTQFTTSVAGTPSTQHHNQQFYIMYEDQIRQNQSLIRRVLAYWFGQYEPDTAQKKLWMIAASSNEYRATIDSDIDDLFTPLLCELATAAESNTTIHDDGDEAQPPSSSCRWKQWCADKDMYGYQGKLAAIIVLDQFSRHIRRHHQETKGNTDALPCPQEELDKLALRTAQLLTEAHSSEIQCGMIPLPQYVFGLMPYRHASTLESVQYVQTCVEQAANLNLQLEDMTSRFRKATNRRMAVLQDEARRTGKATTATTSAGSSSLPSSKPDEEEANSEVDTTTAEVSASSKVFTDDDILETFPFDADMSDASDHVIVKTIQSFLADRGIHPVGGGANQKQSKKKKSHPKSTTMNNQHDNKPDPVTAPPCSLIVSLSGGVDSMVIASALAYLKSELYPNMHITGIHIDYANRPESKAESDFVERYCNQHGIRFVVRRIEEVTRGITARDEYELRARQVRYDLYRTTAAEERAKYKGEEGNKDVVVGVMLGHHRGDLRENVLSNAHKGCGPLDLSGMTAVSQNDGVTIYRPLLPLEKNAVYDYAHRYGVPYFKDTTPHWSTRGKLRNKLLPLLEEIYGEGSMNNLSTLATESDECRELLHAALLKPFMDRVVRTPMGIVFETAPFIAQARGLFFWKFVLRQVLHSAGLGMFSDKSVISFLERINPQHTCKKTIREGWLQCRKDYAVYLQADGKVFVFYPDSFPWRKSDGYKCIGQSVDTTEQKAVAVGPWIVEAEICDINDTERQSLVKRKAVASMDQFMTGYVEYYLEVPHAQSALVFTESFRKNTRPPAWKNTDEKIQEILPLLCVPDASLQEMVDPTAQVRTSVVRVTLDRRFSTV